MTTDRTRRVIMLIDYDNLQICASRDAPGTDLDLHAVMELAQSYGTVVVARAYAEWNMPGERLAVYKAGIDPIFAPVLRTDSRGRVEGKSLCDTVMVAEGVDLLWTLSPDVLVLVTSDKDLIPLARVARARGASVVVIGSDLTAVQLVEMCNVLITYRQLLKDLGKTADAAPPSTPSRGTRERGRGIAERNAQGQERDRDRERERDRDRDRDRERPARERSTRTRDRDWDREREPAPALPATVEPVEPEPLPLAEAVDDGLRADDPMGEDSLSSARRRRRRRSRTRTEDGVGPAGDDAMEAPPLDEVADGIAPEPIAQLAPVDVVEVPAVNGTDGDVPAAADAEADGEAAPARPRRRRRTRTTTADAPADVPDIES